MLKPRTIVATALSTVVLAGAIGIGVASADPTTSPAPSATATPGAAAPSKAGPAAKAKRDLARRALHGEVTLGGKQHRVVDVQRGTVSAVSTTSLTVVSTDGYTATYVVDAQTKVRRAKQQAAISDVRTGDRVRVTAVKDSTTLTAKRVVDRTK